MWKKVLVVGATTAAIVGAGTAALAVTGGSSPTTTPSTQSGAASAGHGKAARGRAELRRALHGSVVTRGKGGTFVTHDGIKGTVTAVSSTSITVLAADKTSETFVVNGSTVVHTKAEGKNKGTTGAIGSVQVNDKVGVLGTGTDPMTATHVLDATR